MLDYILFRYVFSSYKRAESGFWTRLIRECYHHKSQNIIPAIASR
jgi:hypothetical protein